jgi:hypothetical protein
MSAVLVQGRPTFILKSIRLHYLDVDILDSEAIEPALFSLPLF